MFKRIFIFGDSIVWGSADLESGGWVDRFKLWFRNEYGKFNQVYNLGIPGSTSKKLLERIESEIKNRKSNSPRKYIALIVLSVNDAAFLGCSKNKQVLLSEYLDVLNRFIQKAKPLVDKIVLVGQSNVDDEMTGPNKGVYDNYSVVNHDIKKYIKIAKDYCKKNNYPFIDLFGLLNKNDTEDGLHPNAAGHEKIFKRVKEFLLNNKII